MTSPLLVGSVAYTPNVVTIWKGSGSTSPAVPRKWTSFCSPLRASGRSTRQRSDRPCLEHEPGLGTGNDADRWSCRALAQRDTDTVFQTIFVSRAGAGLTGLKDL